MKALKSLPSLTSLGLSGCSKLQSCSGIENLTALEYLDVGKTAVHDLSLTHSSLQSLTVNECSELTAVDFSGLNGIQQIALWKCKSLKTVRGLNGLHSLETLSVVHNESLETVGVLLDLPQLISIDIKGCPKLLKLKVIDCNCYDSFYELSEGEVKELWIERCDGLKDLGIYGPEEVLFKKLTIKDCGISEREAACFQTRYPEIEFVYEAKQ